MRVAFLSDIHANLPALRAALESAARHRVDRLVVAGDVVGSGPHPVEVIRVLKERRVSAILGNVERKLLALKGREKALKKGLKKKKSAHLAWTAGQLGSLEWEWLESLPDHQLLSIRENHVLVVHGSGLADDDYIFPSITGEGLKSKISGTLPEVLVCGHSHIPFIKVVAGVRVINCGSVGRPVDGDPRGSYVLADFPKPKSMNATIVRFSYPVDAVIQDLNERKVPFALGDEYLKGIKQRGV